MTVVPLLILTVKLIQGVAVSRWVEFVVVCGFWILEVSRFQVSSATRARDFQDTPQRWNSFNLSRISFRLPTCTDAGK